MFENKRLRNLDKLVNILEEKRSTPELRGKERIGNASLAEDG